MRIAVFEDDPKFAAWLESIIRRHTHHPTAINTGTAGELIRWIKRAADPVLYLLDIESDGKTTGFQIARHITEQQSSSLVIFITAYPHKILSNPVFKTKAFSIILKSTPTLEQEIITTIALAKQVFQAKCLYVHMGKSETLYIPHEQICYVEAVKGTNKVCIHCTDGQYVIRATLKSLQEQLTPFGFVRCHKSIIVNRANIRKRDKSNMILTFHNGASCPYSYLMQGGLNELGNHDIQ